MARFTPYSQNPNDVNQAHNTLVEQLNKYANSAISDSAYSTGWNGDINSAPSKNAVYDKIETLLLAAWPIGSIYVGVSTNSPSALFGGTWSAFGAGRTLVGLSTETEFDTIEETGGAKTHTLSIAEMPSHNHTLVDTAGNTPIDRNGAWAPGAATLAVNGGAMQDPIIITYTGGSTSHNNLQPYITVRFWKRTA